MTKNIRENPLSSEKNHYLKRALSNEENAENGLIHKRKIKRKNSGGIILLIILLLGIVWYCWSNYTPVTYLQVEESLSIPNEGTSIEIELSTDAISSSISVSSSEDWIDCRVSGKTLYVSANTNPKGERSATITITAHSSFFGSELSDRKQETITVSQETGYASHLSVSNDDIYLSANGGISAISINTDGIFVVSTAPASWVSTSINGKTLNLECDENSGIARSSYLILKSGTKALRLDITQAGKQASFLNPLQTNISVSHSGGTRTITVTTDGTWEFGTDTESWIDLSRSGNTITLEIEENPNIESRDDYFTIKSGDIEKKITIEQSGNNKPRASIDSIWVDHNDYHNGYKGMRIHVDWNVTNCRNKTVYIVYEFYKSDNQTSINLYGISKSQLQYKLKPEYTETSYRDSWQFIPYVSFNYLPSGDYSFDVVIKDDSGKTLVRNENNTFTLTR